MSRRELAVRSARLGAAAAVPALAGGLTLPHAALAQGEPKQTPSDTLLIGPIGIEETLASLYAKAQRSGRLSAANRRLVAVLGKQSREHAAILREQLSDEKFAPAAGGELPGLGARTSGPQYLETALGFENQAYISYLDAIGSLPDEELALTITGIAGSTAQHLSLLRQALGREPILAPAETGAGF